MELGDIDQLLHAAMPLRPEVKAPGDLAATALTRARRAEVRLAQLRRIAGWIRLCSLAAAVLIFVTVAGVVYLSPTSAQASQALDSATVSSDSDASTSVWPEMSSGELLLLTAMIMGISIKVVLTPPRETTSPGAWAIFGYQGV